MKYFKAIVSITIFLGISYLGLQILRNSQLNQVYKQDSAELNHFTYGLFSVNAWKSKISRIIYEEIEKVQLSSGNEKVLRTHLERQLEVIIDKVNEKVKSLNSQSTGGKIKQKLIEAFVNVSDIKEGIPEYARAVMNELSESGTEEKVRNLIKSKINSYMKKTFDIQPDSGKKYILERYEAADEEKAKTIVDNLIKTTEAKIDFASKTILALAIALVVLVAFSKKNNTPPPSQYISLTLSLMVLLYLGVSTPMIDMEAKIAQLKFVLFDHPIEFRNQVLFFQSKSILDVFKIMIGHQDFQMKVVGILMIIFSIVFPVLKMVSSICYYFDLFKSRRQKVIQYFVLYSGKWSMADVVVVAIFMAYIGLNGVVNSQLSELRESAQGIDVITTNGTSLQPGFYLFFTYAILAMFLAGMLKPKEQGPRP